jgi:hypothetical protein
MSVVKRWPEELTIVVKSEYSLWIEDGVKDGARLIGQAAGLDIYICGKDNARHPDSINNLMMNMCLLRHIPVSSLHLVNSAHVRTSGRKTNTRKMF